MTDKDSSPLKKRVSFLEGQRRPTPSRSGQGDEQGFLTRICSRVVRGKGKKGVREKKAHRRLKGGILREKGN